MFVLPVIDLKGGQVVLGRAGRRESYLPVQSVLCQGSSPANVARAFQRLGLSHFYLADLDAISGAKPDYSSYDQIAPFANWLSIDAGFATMLQARALKVWARHRNVRLICGLESLQSLDEMRDMLLEIGEDRFVVSLDLFNGKVRTKVPQWDGADPMDVARDVIELGVRKLIVLDVAQVGTSTGTGTRALCRAIRRMSPHVEITSGGGVGSLADLRNLSNDGCQFSLLASALHDGRIGEAQLKSAFLCPVEFRSIPGNERP